MKLIFSNRLQYRILRHTAFWLDAVVFFSFSYWFPTYWFPEWNTHGVNSPALQGPLDLFQKFLLIRFGYSLLMHVFYDVFHLLVNLFFITPIFAQEKICGICNRQYRVVAHYSHCHLL